MTAKHIIEKHFSETATVWQQKIYKPVQEQRLFEYFDKQYRFDYVTGMIPGFRCEDSRALDVGCGAGQLLPVLSAFGYEVHGIDVSAKMLEMADQLCRCRGVKARLKVDDCERLQYPDEHFDLYVAMGVIEYLDSDDLMLQEIKRVLRPGGLAIITTRNVRSVHVRWRSLFQHKVENPILNVLRVLMGRPTKAMPSISREHHSEALKARLQELGFLFLDERYAHFHVLPYPLSRFFYGYESVVGKWMERRFSRGRLPRLASTYIVKFSG